MKGLKSTYKSEAVYNGLTHDRLSRSAFRLAGLDPRQRQQAGEARALARLQRRARARAATTAVLALAWLGLVWLAIR